MKKWHKCIEISKILNSSHVYGM